MFTFGPDVFADGGSDVGVRAGRLLLALVERFLGRGSGPGGLAGLGGGAVR